MIAPISNNSIFLAVAIDRLIMLFSIDGGLLGSYGDRVID
jgi:hypothetical protein